MPRRTFVLLCGFLTACGCTVLARIVVDGAAVPLDCRDGNFTACETKRIQEVEARGGQAMRMARRIEGGTERNEVEEVASRKKKHKGYGQMLLYFLGASKLTMLYVAMNTIAAIAGKALIVGKIALAIATAIALKKAFEHKEEVSYEIVKHPHHTYEQTHSSSFDFDHQGGFGENDFGYRNRRRSYR